MSSEDRTDPDDCPDAYVWPDEQAYALDLAHQRHMFAWCLVVYGHLTPTDAADAAMARYPCEPEDAPFRGMMFHLEAWDWAMLHLFGETYWQRHPELKDQSPEYAAESAAFDAARQGG